MKQSFWNRKIPTLVGLLVITVGIIATTFLVKGGSLFQIKAGPGQDPKNVQITNVSDASFTLSYITSDQVIGTLNFGSESSLLDSVVLDDRDQLSQSVNKYKAHSITVRDLEPNTRYYFTIISGDKKYLKNNSPYEIKTGLKIDENPSSQVPLSGKVSLPDGSFPSEGLAYVNIDGSQKISTYIKNDGTYTIPLNNLRNSALDNHFVIDSNTIINVEIYAENLFSSVSVSPGDISPVPLITLSNTYDFSTSQDVSSAPTESSGSGSFPTFGKLRAQGGGTEELSPTLTPTPSSQAVLQTSTSPTPTLTSTPTLTPTPTPTSEITPIPSLPPTGNSSVIIASVAALFAGLAGAILFFLTHGQRAL